MEGFLRHPPPALFRTATLIGCFALLLGVAGVFYFGGRDHSWRATLPRDASTVLLRGIEDQTDLAVEVTWPDADGRTAREAGSRGSGPGFWTFRDAPEAVPLRLTVYREGGEGRVMIHQQHAIFTRGGGFEVLLKE
ncbi:MAG: hypothetical protein QNJ90_16485 [Planctomycetota bacterium]|nr:hypothetical protein [Planctomycetota bacterium]